jgi:hypothetical protein
VGKKESVFEVRAREIVGSVQGLFVGEDLKDELVAKIADAIRTAEGKKRAKPKTPGTPSSRIVGRFCELWQFTYKGKADILGKDVGHLSRLAKDLGEDRALQLLEAFFRMPAYIKSRHDPASLMFNIKAVAHFCDTNMQITDTQLRNADKSSTRSEQARRVLEGTL